MTSWALCRGTENAKSLRKELMCFETHGREDPCGEHVVKMDTEQTEHIFFVLVILIL
jgi:hypothetical protein